MKESQRDEVNTGTGEKGTVCEPCLHHRHPRMWSQSKLSM
jgi:hypothetical protein